MEHTNASDDLRRRALLQVRAWPLGGDRDRGRGSGRRTFIAIGQEHSVLEEERNRTQAREGAEEEEEEEKEEIGEEEEVEEEEEKEDIGIE